MLTKEQIVENKNTFLKLISEINREGANTKELVEFLDSNGFFTDPASTQYHNNHEGGLCEHSLNVYYSLVNLYDLYKKYLPHEYSKDTLLIVGLLHDISKTGYYEKYIKNQKYYYPSGSKRDNGGTYDWIAVDSYKVKDAKDRFLFGTHEENSLILIQKFISLTEEEMIAICNHHSGLGTINVNYDLSAISNKFPLQPLLHSADYLCTFIKERV